MVGRQQRSDERLGPQSGRHAVDQVVLRRLEWYATLGPNGSDLLLDGVGSPLVCVDADQYRAGPEREFVCGVADVEHLSRPGRVVLLPAKQRRTAGRKQTSGARRRQRAT